MRNLILLLAILLTGIVTAQVHGPFRGVTFETSTGLGTEGIRLTISGAVTPTINTTYKVVDPEFLGALLTTSVDGPVAPVNTEWAPAWNTDNINHIIAGQYSLTQSRTLNGEVQTRTIDYTAIIYNPTYTWGGDAAYGISQFRLTTDLNEAKNRAQLLSRRPTTVSLFLLSRTVYRVDIVASQTNIGSQVPNLVYVNPESIGPYMENGIQVSYTNGNLDLPEGQIGGTVVADVPFSSGDELDADELEDLGFSAQDIAEVYEAQSGLLVFYSNGQESRRVEIIGASLNTIEISDSIAAQAGDTWIIFLD